MIAKKTLDNKYIEWNKKWGAPWGYSANLNGIFKLLNKFSNLINKNDLIRIKTEGAFAFQTNSSTRIFEYPWAFYATSLRPNMKVIEIGGGFSGLQFVLAKHNLQVTNIDPGDENYKWNYTLNRFNQLNIAYDTNINLIQNTLDNADIESKSIDRIYCISVLEHLSEKERTTIINESYRVLKNGGLFVITVDLFLDIYPFTKKRQNKWGSNMNIFNTIKNTKFKLYRGNKSELYGFPEFNSTRVKDDIKNYLISDSYPVLTQAFVLSKT